MKINKSNPTENIQLSIDINECKNQSVVIVDDVLNSGKTLAYAVKHFLDIEIDLKKREKSLIKKILGSIAKKIIFYYLG